TFIVILLETLSAAIGESLLSYGMKRNGQVNLAIPSQWGGLILSVIRNPYVLAGVVFLAFFFFLYLAALSWADLSFVMPLTAVSYIFAALLARFVLKEDLSWFRWVGTIVITLGIILVALDSRQRSEDNGITTYQQSINSGGTHSTAKGRNS